MPMMPMTHYMLIWQLNNFSLLGAICQAYYNSTSDIHFMFNSALPHEDACQSIKLKCHSDLLLETIYSFFISSQAFSILYKLKALITCIQKLYTN